MTGSIILISIVVVFLCIFFAVYLSRRPKLVAKEKKVNYLKASINYKVSFRTIVDSVNYTLINVSLTNNNSYDLGTVQINSHPSCALIDELSMRNPEKTANINLQHLYYKSIAVSSFSIPAGDVATGYLIYKSYDDDCAVDEITFAAGEQSAAITVHKEWILKETIANRQFN